jgi:hypothetical protein
MTFLEGKTVQSVDLPELTTKISLEGATDNGGRVRVGRRFGQQIGDTDQNEMGVD